MLPDEWAEEKEKVAKKHLNMVDLSVLYRNVKDSETVYRLTELYLPWNED